MLADSLVTNEIKNSAGAEVEFHRILTGPGRMTEFAQIGEAPAYQFRLHIKHVEAGAGLKLVRRSLVRFDKTVLSSVDSITPVTISFYQVAVIPVGHLTTNAEPAHVNAALLSFNASLGATTTILYDGTGNGSAALLSGGI